MSTFFPLKVAPMRIVLKDIKSRNRKIATTSISQSLKAAVRSKAVGLLLLTFCLLLLPLWDSVIVLCFVVRFFMPLLVLQSSWWGRESWFLCLVCLPGFW